MIRYIYKKILAQNSSSRQTLSCVTIQDKTNNKKKTAIITDLSIKPRIVCVRNRYGRWMVISTNVRGVGQIPQSDFRACDEIKADMHPLTLFLLDFLSRG